MYDNFLNQLNVEGVGAVVAAPDEVSTFTIEMVDFDMPPAAAGLLQMTKNGRSTPPTPSLPRQSLDYFVSKFLLLNLSLYGLICGALF